MKAGSRLWRSFPQRSAGIHDRCILPFPEGDDGVRIKRGGLGRLVLSKQAVQIVGHSGEVRTALRQAAQTSGQLEVLRGSYHSRQQLAERLLDVGWIDGGTSSPLAAKGRRRLSQILPGLGATSALAHGAA